MDRLLKVGDLFRSEKLGPKLYGDVVVSGKDNVPPYVDFTKLKTSDYGGEVHVAYTETKEDGWHRHLNIVLKTKVTDPKVLNATWQVVETKFCGGGTAHGPYDVYPDGHWVKAKRLGGDEIVDFYQDGCFTGMIPMEDVNLVLVKEDNDH